MLKDVLFLISYKLFARIQRFFHAKLNINLPGFEFLLGNIKKDYVANIHGHKIYFNHKIAKAYDRLLAGLWNEPETHLFLKRVIDKMSFKLDFINVGACAGEFVIDMAHYKKVNTVFAFEPISEACKAIQISCSINRYTNVKIINIALSDSTNPLMFFYNERAPAGSTIFPRWNKSYMVNSSTLDMQFSDYKGQAIILIDSEGAELKIIRGGASFIKRNLPLIIFEYNNVSKQQFSLNEIKNILGNGYKIYRINPSGYLDGKFNNTWNMAAINPDSSFLDAVKLLVR